MADEVREQLRAQRERMAAVWAVYDRPPAAAAMVEPEPEAEPEPEPVQAADGLAPAVASGTRMSTAGESPLLLVLDLDGTLLSASRIGSAQHKARERGLRLPPQTFTVRDRGGYDVWLRPGCAAFLLQLLSEGHELAVWTAAPAWYATLMVEGIERHAPCPGFASRLRAIFCEDEAEVSWRGSGVVKKDLRLLARKVDRPLWRCLIVDDTPSTYAGNVSNALPVQTFRPDRVSDDTLPALASFLSSVAVSRPLEVRGWRHASSRARPLVPEQRQVSSGRTTGGAAADPGSFQPESGRISDAKEEQMLHAAERRRTATLQAIAARERQAAAQNAATDVPLEQQVAPGQLVPETVGLDP